MPRANERECRASLRHVACYVLRFDICRASACHCVQRMHATVCQARFRAKLQRIEESRQPISLSVRTGSIAESAFTFLSTRTLWRPVFLLVIHPPRPARSAVAVRPPIGVFEVGPVRRRTPAQDGFDRRRVAIPLRNSSVAARPPCWREVAEQTAVERRDSGACGGGCYVISERLITRRCLIGISENCVKNSAHVPHRGGG